MAVSLPTLADTPCGRSEHHAPKPLTERRASGGKSRDERMFGDAMDELFAPLERITQWAQHPANHLSP